MRQPSENPKDDASNDRGFEGRTELRVSFPIADDMSSDDVKGYLAQLQNVLPNVQPISAGPLKALHAARDYKGMVQLIKRAMSLEDVTFLVFRVPEGLAQQKEQKDAPAWVLLPKPPDELPFHGTKEFKGTSLKMYFRKSFLERHSYDQVAIVIAHELSHVVLDSIRHPLRREERAVDLTAMLLGFRSLYVSGAHREHRSGNSIKTDTIGYLSAAEVHHANHLLENRNASGNRKSKWVASLLKKMKARFQPMDLIGWLLLIAFVMALLSMVGLGSSLLVSRS